MEIERKGKKPCDNIILCWCWDVDIPQGTTGEFLLALIELNWFQLKNALSTPSSTINILLMWYRAGIYFSPRGLVQK